MRDPGLLTGVYPGYHAGAPPWFSAGCDSHLIPFRKIEKIILNEFVVPVNRGRALIPDAEAGS